MKNFIDKEYHPVIEDFISDYVDENMGSVERETFEEVLVHDDDLRELAFSAKEGKRLMAQFREIKAKKDFTERLLKQIRN
ncbi:MAG: hypothetical protein CL670_09925 [Balneola sp.]|jgi:hypothetical protein|nr:hypothetical protein [Balneola sp.]MBE79461.1 hypothetical protein [Balneola sp.]|tara:strand:- start:342 stop:581 length:240 start_codon:yes stop_codon:yes gene_type:complete